MPASLRPLARADLPRLQELDCSYVSDAVLALERTDAGWSETHWGLALHPLDRPYDKGRGYDLDELDVADITRRLGTGKCLEWIAEDKGRLVGLLDVEPVEPLRLGLVWNILVDHSCRRRGIGRRFVQRAVEWAQSRGMLALMAETQAQNLNACRFYSRMGFVVGGVDDHLYRYSRDPQAAREVAVFWYLEFKGA
jgi:streptothricin acetyltransferase